jgi:hypothetical protein
MLPLMTRIRQRFNGSHVGDPVSAVHQALRALDLTQRIRPGMIVGIPVGSRGIRNLVVMIRELVRYLRELGAEPRVIAAMGSHGGGTAVGQVEVLRSLGITEPVVGAPVIGSVDAEVVGTTPDGRPVYFDRLLLGCDGLVILNRVKPHTSFRGPIESGLVKMLVVGCGKSKGAQAFHLTPATELSTHLQMAGQILLDRLPILGGIAIIENTREETAMVVAVRPDAFLADEAALLVQAKLLLPRLPVADLDLLVVDEMGKNISGTGMDTNIIGRWGVPGMAESDIRIRRLVVLDLRAVSHGYANGVGLADLVSRRLTAKIDFQATYLNTLTATFVDRAKLPITLETDRAVIEAAMGTLGLRGAPRIARIKNTLNLEHVWVSPAVLDDIPASYIEGVAMPWSFDRGGNLLA